MSSNPIRLKYLFHKYLANNCSREELEEFWQLMSELSENDLVHQELQALWHQEEELPSPAQEELDRVFARVQQRAAPYETSYQPPVRRMRTTIRYALVAASLLLCVALGWWYFSGTRQRPASEPGLLADNQRRTITLPDGSVVVLNKKSHLDYPSAFSDSVREVYLTGEAFFDIQHNPSKPFIVHSGAYVTRVLGTAFNIRAYDRDSLVAITVERGKVQVQRSGEEKALSVLTAGDQLVIDKKTTAPHMAKADVKMVTQWKTSDLVFDDLRFEEAAAIINRQFNITLLFDQEALRNCRFTVDVTGKELDEMLDILTQLTRSKWIQLDEHTIRLEGEGCKN
ncbi:FecR family protein [Paraflavitalea pollutisoli]|uniref:FecR family protein n=1 Tax=Paraflavitalea pollutisoli TaxID=3034143 RepID=UPI0023EB836E|nr:FecR domain-containing protein [Paraflavitalea sp. H1-2-19X]